MTRLVLRSISCLRLWPALILATSAMARDDVPRSRTFELSCRMTVRTIPQNAKTLDIWVPFPQTDPNQTIHQVLIDAPGPVVLGRESRFGNQSVHLRIDRPTQPATLTLTITATRRENPGRNEPLIGVDRERALAPEPLVPLSGPIRALAEDATKGLDSDLEKARAIYDKVSGMMSYDKSGTGWGRGDALYACDAKRGNCTDFHALVIGMARSVGIPARFAIGVSLPESRGSGEIPGYHCWAELYIRDRGWVPVDASEGSKNPPKRDYFFGHHDENRLEFSRGRNLMLNPAQKGQSLNFFVYPYAEVNGRPHDTIERTITFRDR